MKNTTTTSYQWLLLNNSIKRLILIVTIIFLLLSENITFAIGRNTISPSASQQGIKYFVLFTDTEYGPSNSRCAGVLIYYDIVLTTSRCVELLWEDNNNNNVVYARIGYATDYTNNVGVSTVKTMIKNPMWSSSSLFSSENTAKVGDIAIAVLPTPNNFAISTESYFASFLTFDYFDNNNNKDNEKKGMWVILGAGKTSEGDGAFSRDLQGDELDEDIDFTDCYKTYSDLNPSIIVDEKSYFCMGVPNEVAGACSEGDLGAPIVLIMDGYIFVAGLASFGNGCGINDPPSLYTRVSHYSKWIFDTVCNYTTHSEACSSSSIKNNNVSSSNNNNNDYDNNNNIDDKNDDNKLSFFTIISDTTTGPGTTRCGGVLVHEDIILSAAGCVKLGDIVRIGYSTDDQSIAIRNPVDIRNHPMAFVNDEFVFEENLPHDISVIKLSKPIDTSIIAPIIIKRNYVSDNNNNLEFQYAHAGTSEDCQKKFTMGTFSSSSSSISGNTNNDEEPHFYHSVQTGRVQIMNFNTCKQKYMDLPGYHATTLDEDLQFCIQHSTNSPCDGYAWGSPLWYHDNDDSFLVGLASQGQCGSDGMPFVYTRISDNHYDFITETICELSSNPPTSCLLTD